MRSSAPSKAQRYDCGLSARPRKKPSPTSNSVLNARVVCQAACWNAKRSLCYECAPDIESERHKVQTTVEQMKTKLQEQDLTKSMDFDEPKRSRCVGMRRAHHGAKFCPECGKRCAQPAPAESAGQG